MTFQHHYNTNLKTYHINVSYLPFFISGNLYKELFMLNEGVVDITIFDECNRIKDTFIMMRFMYIFKLFLIS